MAISRHILFSRGPTRKGGTWCILANHLVCTKCILGTSLLGTSWYLPTYQPSDRGTWAIHFSPNHWKKNWYILCRKGTNWVAIEVSTYDNQIFLMAIKMITYSIRTFRVAIERSIYSNKSTEFFNRGFYLFPHICCVAICLFATPILLRILQCLGYDATSIYGNSTCVALF